MFASVICVCVQGSIDAGGMNKVWEIANEGGRIQFTDLRLDPSVRHTLWTQLIGGIFTFTSLYAVNQTQVPIAMDTSAQSGVIFYKCH